MSDERAAVTTEEFAEAFRRFHRGELPEVILVDDQTWEDLDSELEGVMRPETEIPGVDRYVREEATDSLGMSRPAWVRHLPDGAAVNVAVDLVMELDGWTFRAAMVRDPAREGLWFVELHDLARLADGPEVGPFGSEVDARAWLLSAVELRVGRIREVRRALRSPATPSSAPRR